MLKSFTLKQLFSIADGRLSGSIEDVYDILNHVTDDDLMTHQLPVAFDYLKEKNPKWLQEVRTDLKVIENQCPVSDRNQEQFEWVINFIDKIYPNKVYEIPQLKAEFDTSDFGKYMVDNSLVLKRLDA